MEVLLMRDLVMQYYKQGLFTIDDLSLFIQAEFISKADYKDLTGKDYDVA